MDNEKKPALALITTPRFRRDHIDELRDFIATDLWDLCRMFSVYSTGGTYGKVMDIVSEFRFGDELATKVDRSTPLQIAAQEDLDKQWSGPIRASIRSVEGGYPGMIRITNDLIMGNIAAIIHLMDWDDVAAKPDTMVLRRQANVHDVPIACDVVTARAMVAGWKARDARKIELCTTEERELQREVDVVAQRLAEVRKGDRVLALIAHDGMKLDMCCFVVQHAKKIVEYDAVLTTGTTGAWIKRFLGACDRSKEEINRVIPCLSGPLGGDVQIAWMVVQGICRNVIFFQDPMVSHAHATDILLFEQALLFKKVERALATNPQTAVELLERRDA
jgi:methylglyoxal synthase